MALIGMIPKIVMYAYSGKLVGDAALLAASRVLPRPPGYYIVLVANLAATVIVATLVMRVSHRGIKARRRPDLSSTLLDHRRS